MLGRLDFLLRSCAEKENPCWQNPINQQLSLEIWTFMGITDPSRNCTLLWSFCWWCFGDVYSKTVTQNVPFRKRISGNPILESFLHWAFLKSKCTPGKERRWKVTTVQSPTWAQVPSKHFRGVFYTVCSQQPQDSFITFYMKGKLGSIK